VELFCFHDLRAEKNPAINAPIRMSGTKYMRSGTPACPWLLSASRAQEERADLLFGLS
jgi:hypothetical protein